MTPVEEQIQKGAMMLDSLEPGWTEKVDVDTLDMSDPSYCVMGQVFRDRANWFGGGAFISGYDYGSFTYFRKDFHKMAEFGFDGYALATKLLTDEDVPSYDELTAAWRALITDRKERQQNGDTGNAVPSGDRL